jgi:hypothetical protein
VIGGLPAPSGVRPSALWAWAAGHRYPLLCLGLVVFVAVRMPGAAQGGDFWQHSAAVRELATHPWHPLHPQLPLDAPTPFNSPYTLLAAALARGADLDAVTALSLMGVVNLALLLVGLHMFVRVVAPGRTDATAFYALLLTLFWWGADPWLYSGFFHVAVLGYVLPYPSTFAAALTLVALGLDGAAGTRTRPARAAATVGLAALVLLAHPLTFLFLAAWLGAEAVTAGRDLARRIASTAVLLALAVGLAALWPYFPLLSLLTSESRVFDSGNEEMYEAVVQRTWPTLALVPIALSGLASRGRRTVALVLAGLTALYAFGGVAGRQSYGRVISYVVLLLHVEIAGTLAWLEGRMAAWPRWQRASAIAGFATVVAVLAWAPMRHLLLDEPVRDRSYAFLQGLTGQYDVVLADADTSRIVPSFGGKVVGASHAFAWVPDQDARLADLARFFEAATTAGARLEILARRDVDHVLLGKSDTLPWQDIRSQLAPWGGVTHDDDAFVLVSRARDARLQSAPRP